MYRNCKVEKKHNCRYNTALNCFYRPVIDNQLNSYEWAEIHTIYAFGFVHYWQVSEKTEGRQFCVSV